MTIIKITLCGLSVYCHEINPLLTKNLFLIMNNYQEYGKNRNEAYFIKRYKSR